jgi:hypothetical protein
MGADIPILLPPLRLVLLQRAFPLGRQIERRVVYLVEEKKIRCLLIKHDQMVDVEADLAYPREALQFLPCMQPLTIQMTLG